jgi:hypothetical protein
MRDILDLDRFPLDQPDSAAFAALVKDCQRKLARDGLFNLPGFVRADALAPAVSTLVPRIKAEAFTHRRAHNIYFKAKVEGLDDGHPALHKLETVNHTLCADQLGDTLLASLHEYPPFIAFLAAVMGKDVLYPMADALARINVMAYNAGEALNWHFDRSEFTTTLLLQAPVAGGTFEYAQDLRSDAEPNYDGVAKLLTGQGPKVAMPLEAGTLNVFRGKNTAHRVTPVQGARARIIAVFSYYERPGVVFTPEDQLGFYGRSA